MTLLEVQGLSAGYGRVDVLRGLDFTVEPGEVVVILGANGAGKTTTLRAVSGQIARRGSVMFDGRPLEKERPDAIVRLGVAQVPQGRGTIAGLTVDENLEAGGYIRKDGDVKKDVDRWYELFPRLAERRKQKAGLLSGGEQQMLAVARALMSRPKLLLCDEPSLGLAPLVVQNLFATLRRLNDETGLALLMVEQNASVALDIAARVYVLEVGEIVTSGDAAAMRENDAIRKAYLGY